MLRRLFMLVFLLLVFGVGLFALFSLTGFLQGGQIDARDLARWNYTQDGYIVGTQPFTLEGETQRCWLLIHSYGATPKEMSELAHRIHNEFIDTVRVVRLLGHATVPSDMQQYSYEDWYEQVAQEYEQLPCSQVIVVGSSIGGALALELGQEYEVEKLVILNPFLSTMYEDLLASAPVVHFAKKHNVAQIHDPRGREQHIAYMNMPFEPLLNSFSRLANVEQNLESIEQPILIMHGPFDRTSSPSVPITIYDSVASSQKELLWMDQSNHILLMDYQREQVIQEILAFAREE
ncbi:MAG: alpha/beta hydrolase [Candidatus Woesearchaeota archaeon]